MTIIAADDSRPPVLFRLGPWALAIIGLALALFAQAAPASAAAPGQPVIVLVGDRMPSYPDGEHDWPDGVLKINRLIQASPEFAALKPAVKVYPAGFPADLSELDDASVVVLYMGVKDGASPLEAPALTQKMDALMARGVGLVALHQAFTVSQQGAASFTRWLGGARIGMADRTTEIAPVSVVPGHPVANGLSAFNYLDEFYPTIDFGNGAGHTPVLTARLHTQFRGSAVFEEPAQQKVIGWAHERAGGGRSFGYTGLHYLGALDNPNVRKMILNAIMWTSGGEVPSAGVTTTLPEAQRVIVRASEAQNEPVPWGKLVWFASRPLGNSTTMTVGQATVSVGTQNPPHWHPNTDEVLYVLQGHIMHRVGDQEYEMRAGDTVSIPAGTIHNARNIGTEDAVLMVSFNSADRYSMGE